MNEISNGEIVFRVIENKGNKRELIAESQNKIYSSYILKLEKTHEGTLAFIESKESRAIKKIKNLTEDITEKELTEKFDRELKLSREYAPQLDIKAFSKKNSSKKILSYNFFGDCVKSETKQFVYYMDMKKLEQLDLLNYLERTKVIDVEAAITISLNIIINVWIFHQNEYIHSDIKPSNFMIDSFLNTFLIDYGESEKKGTTQEAPTGTSGYMPSEVESACKSTPYVVEPSRDIYALIRTLEETWKICPSDKHCNLNSRKIIARFY